MDEVDSLAICFIETASEHIHGLEAHLSASTVRAKYVSHFGCSPRTTARLWMTMMEEERLLITPAGGGLKVHLLWTLDLLKGDDTEHCLKGRWGEDEKTIRKWIALFLECISTLPIVCTYLIILSCLIVFVFFFFSLCTLFISDASNFLTMAPCR